jgi:hypothetical protein
MARDTKARSTRSQKMPPRIPNTEKFKDPSFLAALHMARVRRDGTRRPGTVGSAGPTPRRVR